MGACHPQSLATCYALSQWSDSSIAMFVFEKVENASEGIAATVDDDARLIALSANIAKTAAE